jgi:hypothetical protein
MAGFLQISSGSLTHPKSFNPYGKLMRQTELLVLVFFLFSFPVLVFIGGVE